ncbi:MAG: CHAT domain-containing protein, partial [Myxococcales bacterium]|nr:CHAT domain-containing protein [Myxococcales bacterium]
ARRALQHWAEAFECLDGALSYLGGQRAGIGRNELSRILAESRAGEEGLYRAALQAPQERDLVRLAAAISMQMTGRSLREGAEVGVLGSDLSPSALQGWEQASSGRCGLPAGSGSRPDLPAASAQACLGEQAEVAIDLQRVGSGVDGRYLAFVLSRGRHFQIVDLGSAERLETRAQILLRALRHPWRAYGGAARRVSSMLRPLHEYLRGDVLLCVQGALGLLPFEILPIGARLVSDQASLHYVTSLGGGDPGGRQGGSWDPSKVGAPLFLGDPQLPTSTDRRPGDRRAIRSDGTLPPLPGARAEARAAARAFPESALHLGRDATEGALMSAGSHGGVSPRLIHLAAHGLYAPLPGLAADSPAEPFLRLAPSPGQDGVLRAEEIATELDLAHTELVILSACNSGNGEARAGQGIAGLQHAFLRAGANRVLMTRWSVDDGVSRELMADFVRRLGRQADEGLVHPELALREAARRIRRRRPHPYFWAPFLLLDGSNQR